MIEVLLGIIIFILGFSVGIVIPLIFHEYSSLINVQIENKKSSVEDMEKEDLTKNSFNNLTSELISEWQTGKVIEGDRDE